MKTVERIRIFAFDRKINCLFTIPKAVFNDLKLTELYCIISLFTESKDESFSLNFTAEY